MSKAAELTREELVERLAKVIHASADVVVDYDCPLLENKEEVARAVLSELKALGLVLVPREPTKKMTKAGIDTGFFTDDSGFYNPADDNDANEVWRDMLSSSPFAGN